MGSQRRGPDSFTPRINKMAENPEIWKATPMADHFDKIQKLSEKVEGCPNFRRVPGYKVYCCGQPTVTGFEAALNKVFLLDYFRCLHQRSCCALQGRQGGNTRPSTQDHQDLFSVHGRTRQASNHCGGWKRKTAVG